jgi:hypothetical protein
MGGCTWCKRHEVSLAPSASFSKAGLIRKAASLTPDANDLRYAVCARDNVEHADQDTLTVAAKDIFGI